jgi:hypothetical protein
MNTRNIWQSARFILGAALACALVACAENAVPSRVQPPAAKDVCDEASEYGSRAAAAYSSQVRAALQRIADTKKHECAAKTSVSLGQSAPSSTASR